MIKLGLLAPTLSSASGGLSAAVPNLAFALAVDPEFQIEVIGVEDPDDPKAAEKWGPKVHAFPRHRPRAFQYAPGMSGSLTCLEPDLVDVQGIWNYPSLVNLRHHRRTATPFIVTPHGMLDPWARSRSKFKKRLVRQWFEDQHLRSAACLRATAEMEADHFRSFGLSNPIAVVPNGVDTPPLPPKRQRIGRRRLLFLSRLHPKKGIPNLLRAWSALAPQRPEWELAIAGPDEVGHEAEMRAMAERLKLPRLNWIGPVEGTNKAELYRSSDLFVLPTYAENFGLVVAEAMAHGVPVITTRHAPWSGLEIHRCGWWIELSDAALLDSLLDATARPAADLEEMGARGHAWMEKDFSWQGVADQMRDVYRWVAYGGSKPVTIQD